MQATYPTQMAACVAAARDAMRTLLPPTAAHAAQPCITARTLCYGVSAAEELLEHRVLGQRHSPALRGCPCNRTVTMCSLVGSSFTATSYFSAASQLWAAMGLAVFLAVAARAAQQDRDARAAFLRTSSRCEDTACRCPYCGAQPSTKPAHHVTAYMAVGLLLPWYAAVVHLFVLASS